MTEAFYWFHLCPNIFRRRMSCLQQPYLRAWASTYLPFIDCLSAKLVEPDLQTVSPCRSKPYHTCMMRPDNMKTWTYYCNRIVNSSELSEILNHWNFNGRQQQQPTENVRLAAAGSVWLIAWYVSIDRTIAVAAARLASQWIRLLQVEKALFAPVASAAFDIDLALTLASRLR